MALCIEIADAMVALIEGSMFYSDITLERQWVKDQRLEDLTADEPARVIIVPETLNVTAFDLKPRNEHQWAIGVWIDKKVDDQTNADCDPVAELVEEIVDLLATNRTLAISSAPFRATCIGIIPHPTYDTMQLLDIKVFRSVFLATYRVTK